MTVTINEFFSGIGAQVASFKRLGINYKVVGTSEIDKYAIQSYEAINGPTKNYGDICKITAVDYADLWTYSFPCQDLSQAGKQKGISKGTRSGLLLEVERLLADSVLFGTQPKYLLLENVKALVSKKFKPDFDRWLERLDELGYNNYWQVLNAKDYGVPQNRERVFVVSIRKDVDNGYKFPEPIKLEKRLKDVLDSSVDEKFYLNQKQVESFMKSNFHQERDRVQKKDWCDTLLSRDYKTPKLVIEPLAYDEQNKYLRTDGCTGTIMTDGSSPKHNSRVVEPSVIQLGNFMSSGNWDNPQCGRVYSQEGCSPTLNTCGGGNHEPKIVADYRIRKLTPRECWRLMGFTDLEFDCAQLSGVSNTQLYKQAGNSIVVDVLVAIFKELFNNGL